MEDNVQYQESYFYVTYLHCNLCIYANVIQYIRDESI